MTIEEKFQGLVSLDDASLALFVNPYYVHSFIEFHRNQGDRYNNTTENDLRLAIQLVQEDTGWLRRRPDLIERLPAKDIKVLTDTFKLQATTKEELWHALCDLSLAHLRGYSAKARRLIARHDTQQQERLRPILILPNPDDVLVAIHEQAEAYIPSITNLDRRRHIFADLLLSRLLTETALRRKHFALMRYAPDDSTAHLRRDDDDRFTLHVPIGEFKNWNSSVFRTQKGEDPRKGVQPFSLDDDALQKDLLHYVDFVRPRLLRGEQHDYLFPVYTKGVPASAPAIGSRVKLFTKIMLAASDLPSPIKAVKYLSSHSYRHILGTAIAKRLDLDSAAAFLLDTRDVVSDEYARWIESEQREVVAELVRSSRAKGRR